MFKIFIRLASPFIFLAVSWSLFAAPYSQVSDDGKAAVASVHPLATQAGIKAIEEGGNAVDAALAVAYTLGVVDTHNSGIGGGCFILIRWADGTVQAIDGREMAPAKAHKDMFLVNGEVDKAASKTGALSIGIPGSVAALSYIQEKGGKLSLAQVVNPAAEIAEAGFEVNEYFAMRQNRAAEYLRKFPASAEIFLKKNGEQLQAGDKLIQKDLAKTYRGIAKKGPSYFYKGEVAKATDAWMKKNGGLVRYEDFANYEIKLRQPVVSKFHGYTLYGFPPPSSGGVHVAQILNILDNFDLTTLSESGRYHLLAEAMKPAFADRAYWLGDPDYVKVPKGLISKEYAKTLAKKIQKENASPVIEHGIPPDSEKDFFEQLNKHTTHIATADVEGNWVAITSTINTSYGSKVVIPGTGVVMNNQMDDFSAKEGVPNAFNLVGAFANSVQPNKRPLSSMSPTLVVKDNKPVMTLGAAGGPTIINQVVQTIVNYLVLDMPLENAVAQYRIHHQWTPDRIIAEGAMPTEVKKALEEKGHNVQTWDQFGSTQAIAYRDGKFISVSEPRIQ